ncbi:hypothetical protein M0G74_09035 [Microbulbifer sp. CAU 1566]|uniref:hypothetical protein n=1 Tax=Microbulbifer sp. CAU 1566 TaxID=2933269 RepID=UPI0020063928|nr:hypothetical protein [Microbulbifer sp. CAU 1566]MCK7597410.1 hypothetical protein [Microbulbifer sp. CAU 1566]
MSDAVLNGGGLHPTPTEGAGDATDSDNRPGTFKRGHDSRRLPGGRNNPAWWYGQQRNEMRHQCQLRTVKDLERLDTLIEDEETPAAVVVSAIKLRLAYGHGSPADEVKRAEEERRADGEVIDVTATSTADLQAMLEREQAIEEDTTT